MTPIYPDLSEELAISQNQLAIVLDSLAQAEAANASYKKTVAHLTQENTLLRQKIDLLTRRIFGVKSEKVSSEQLDFLLQLDGEDRAKTAAADMKRVSAKVLKVKKQPKKRKARSWDHLPVETTVIDPPEVTAAPHEWRCIGQVVTEQLDYSPAQYIRRCVVRRKFVRIDQPFRAPIIAQLPERLLDRSLPAPGLLAHIIVGKFCDHLPFYRQEQIALIRHEVDLPRQTLARWMQMTADWLILIYLAIKSDVLSGGYIQADETCIKYLEPGHGKTKHGYLWTFLRPGGSVFFCWKTSRAAACLEEIIPKDQPLLKMGVDAYSAYSAFRDDRPGKIILCGCLSHGRREFIDGQSQAPRIVGVILLQFRRLYAIEAELKETQASPDERQRRREKDSRPHLERLHRIVTKLHTKNRFLPKSQLGGAVTYFLNQWEKFQEFLKDGRVEIDNNLVENAIRPTAIGKKNWLFFGDADAGQANAVLYTIVENCRQHKINPWRYLRDILTLLPEAKTTSIATLLPAAWAKAQATKTTEPGAAKQAA
jgi:transposase